MPEELLFIVIDNLTGKEPDTSEIALHEEWAQDLLYCDIDGWVLGDAGDLGLCDDTGKVRWAPLKRFTWTSALKAERDDLRGQLAACRIQRNDAEIALENRKSELAAAQGCVGSNTKGEWNALVIKCQALEAELEKARAALEDIRDAYFVCDPRSIQQSVS